MPKSKKPRHAYKRKVGTNFWNVREENSSKYELNEVELAVVPKNPSDERTEVCILPYHAFKGYVTDTIFIFEREFLTRICRIL